MWLFGLFMLFRLINMWHLINKFQNSGFEKSKQTLFCAPFSFLAVRFWSWRKLAFELEGLSSVKYASRIDCSSI